MEKEREHEEGKKRERLRERGRERKRERCVSLCASVRVHARVRVCREFSLTVRLSRWPVIGWFISRYAEWRQSLGIPYCHK